MRFVHIHASFSIRPHNGTATNADTRSYTGHGILQREAAKEQFKQRTEANHTSLLYWTLAVADQRFPHLKMFGGIAHMADVDICAAHIHIFEVGIRTL